MGFIQKIVFHIIATSVLFWAIANFIFPENFLVEGGLISFPIMALVFGTMNLFIKPILRILTFPIHFITLGLFSVILNAIMLYLWQHVTNFLGISGVQIEIRGLLTYLLIGVIFAFANAMLHWFER